MPSNLPDALLPSASCGYRRAIILHFQHNERFTLRNTHGNILGVRVFDGVRDQLRRRVQAVLHLLRNG